MRNVPGVALLTQVSARRPCCGAKMWSGLQEPREFVGHMAEARHWDVVALHAAVDLAAGEVFIRDSLDGHIGEPDDATLITVWRVAHKY